MAVNNLQLLNSTTDKIHVIDMKNNSGVFVTGDINYDVILVEQEIRFILARDSNPACKESGVHLGSYLGKFFMQFKLQKYRKRGN